MVDGQILASVFARDDVDLAHGVLARFAAGAVRRVPFVLFGRNDVPPVRAGGFIASETAASALYSPIGSWRDCLLSLSNVGECYLDVKGYLDSYSEKVQDCASASKTPSLASAGLPSF